MFLVRQAVLSNDGEEQLAPGLGQEHPHESPGAGPYVVRTEPAELDLARHVTLEEPENLLITALPNISAISGRLIASPIISRTIR